MLDNLYPHPRLSCLLHIQQQAVVASNTLLPLAKDFFADPLRLNVRDVHISLCMDDLQRSHLPRNARAVAAEIIVFVMEELWLGGQSVVVS